MDLLSHLQMAERVVLDYGRAEDRGEWGDECPPPEGRSGVLDHLWFYVSPSEEQEAEETGVGVEDKVGGSTDGGPSFPGREDCLLISHFAEGDVFTFTYMQAQRPGFRISYSFGTHPIGSVARWKGGMQMR